MKILFITDLIPICEDENCAKALIPIIKELQVNNSVDIIRPNFLLNSLIRNKKILKNGYYSSFGLRILNLNFLTPFLGKTNVVNLDNYDKVIAHMPSGILFTEMLLRQKSSNKPKIVYAVHQSDIQVLTNIKYSIYFRQILKNAYKTCDEIICRSPHLKNKLLKTVPQVETKTIIKTSKIPANVFVSEKEMLEKFEDLSTLKFITVANLIKRKNIELLIRVFEKYKNKNFILKVVGSGPEEKRLKNLCKKLKLEEKIIFTGKLSQDKVFEEMGKSQIFILPSVNETLGLVYLEAFANGCFCIGTKNTGIDGIFQDNINCFLTEATINGVSKTLEKTFNLTKDDFCNLLKNRDIADFKSTF